MYSVSVFIDLLSIVQATDVQEKETDFNPEFVARMIPRLEWTALVNAMNMV